MNYYTTGDTIVALATAPGMGAIAVLRLSGKDAIRIADGMFVPKKNRNSLLKDGKSHTLHYGTIMNGPDVVDEVLLAVMRAPSTYTGEDVVEISCHGSVYVQQQLLQLCRKYGARLANPGEFTLRAFLNGKMDLSQAEAVADLIASESSVQHDVALKQMRGGFSGEIAELRKELIHFASLIELELDFGEEDVEFASRDDLKKLIEKLQSAIAQLVNSFELGNVIRKGIPVVIAGKPNAGKSTLMNALLNENRAIVSEVAGTTRDTIEEEINLGGIKFRFIDTAGLRETEDLIEKEGVTKAFEKINASPVALLIFDVNETDNAELKKQIDEIKNKSENELRIVAVGNKIDDEFIQKSEVRGENAEVKSQKSKVKSEKSEVRSEKSEVRSGESEAESERSEVSGQESEIKSDAIEENIKFFEKKYTVTEKIIFISAKEKLNIDELKNYLLSLYDAGQVKNNNSIVTSVRHAEALKQTAEALTAVTSGLNSGITNDFIAADIRRALYHLGEITGEISTEDLLANIFGKFCIGK